MPPETDPRLTGADLCILRSLRRRSPQSRSSLAGECGGGSETATAESLQRLRALQLVTGNGGWSLTSIWRRREKILLALAPGPRITSELALLVAEEHGKVYRDCKRLEAVGLLRSRKIAGAKKVYFCLVTRQVVTQANYERIRAIHARLRAILEAHAVGSPALQRELRRYLAGIGAFAFLEEILAALAAGASTSELRARVGLRPIPLWVLEWRLTASGEAYLHGPALVAA